MPPFGSLASTGAFRSVKSAGFVAQSDGTSVARFADALHSEPGAVTIVPEEYSLNERPGFPAESYVRIIPGCVAKVSRAPLPFELADVAGTSQLCVASEIWPMTTFVATSASCFTTIPDS